MELVCKCGVDVSGSDEESVKAAMKRHTDKCPKTKAAKKAK